MFKSKFKEENQEKEITVVHKDDKLSGDESKGIRRKELELQSKINASIRDFADKLIIQLNEEKKFDPCRNTNCNDCLYAKGCHEGELAHKVATDNIIEIVNKLVKEFNTEGE